MDLDNRRAFSILEKDEITAVERKFLKTHFEMYSQLAQSLGVEILVLKDKIDYGEFLNHEVLSMKENLIKIVKQSKTEDLLSSLNKFFEAALKQGVENEVDGNQS